MMMTDTYYLYLLLTSNALLLVTASLAVIRFEHRCRRMEKFWSSPTGTAVSEFNDNDVRRQVEATHRLEKQLGELRRAVKVMVIQAPKQAAPTERSLPIETAVRMARSGASIEELKRSCGLNNGEARLMKKLHGRAPLAAIAK